MRFPLILFLLASLPLVANEDYARIAPFLKDHCIKCHGPDKEKGGVRFDIAEDIDEALWTDIHAQIESGEMPPDDEPQPAKKDREAITKIIYALLTDEKVTLSTGLRRLNKREYRNTVRDLLGLHNGIFDPALYLYDDEVDHGFDTNAESLVISDELLMEYMKAAEISLDAALFIPSQEKPENKSRSFDLSKMKGGDRRFTDFSKDSAILRIGGSAIIYASESQRDVPISGKYRIKVTACGTDRDNYPIRFPPVSGPVKMNLGITSRSSDGIFQQRKHLATYDLKDEEPETFEVEVWISKGTFPYIAFQNGSSKPASLTRAAIRRRQIKAKEAKTGHDYIGPGIKVTDFTVEGPLDLEWPPTSYATTFWVNEIPDLESATVRRNILKQFIWRAFRRPVEDRILPPYLRYLENRQKETGDWQEAMLNTFTAVLSSHDFLYIYEGKGELNAFELVSRLSYFLWSSMPDIELFKLANSEDILKEEVYLAQIKRMLADPKAEAFKTSFATQWLSLDLLGSMRPDIKNRKYKAYYRMDLEAAFRKESQLFFNYIANENRSIREFLDSDYTFVNKALAEVYDLPFKGGNEHQLIKIPADSDRGGLLGHGSIHALTSNGVETLPVTRGHWVLDELLGSPPPPPPAEVPAIVPDLNGTTTVREQLEKHREDPSCMKCHVAMDPPGLALEAYDIIGRHRTRYPNGKKIDTSGKFLGVGFRNISELKSILVQHDEFFAKSFITKIAEYAKGRNLNPRDLEIVDQITQQAAKKDYRFQSILAEILRSDLMKHR
ncbi:MAG: DUF1592 domain-containing protein [Akkermansiaceae bacterium]